MYRKLPFKHTCSLYNCLMIDFGAAYRGTFLVLILKITLEFFQVYRLDFNLKFFLHNLWIFRWRTRGW